MASLTQWTWIWVAPGVGDGHGVLACCGSWGHKESDLTERLNWTELTRWTLVGKVMSLLLNMLSRLVITFLPRSKSLLISWLQSLSAVILEPPKIKSATVSPFICYKVMGPDAMIFVFWMLSFKPTFSSKRWGSGDHHHSKVKVLKLNPCQLYYTLSHEGKNVQGVKVWILWPSGPKNKVIINHWVTKKQ